MKCMEPYLLRESVGAMNIAHTLSQFHHESKSFWFFETAADTAKSFQSYPTLCD